MPLRVLAKAATKVFYNVERISGAETTTDLVSDETLREWSEGEDESVQVASLVLQRNANGEFHFQGTPYNYLNIELHLFWPRLIQASDPRIDLDARAIRIARVARTIDPVSNESGGVGKATLSLHPEDVEPVPYSYLPPRLTPED